MCHGNGVLFGDAFPRVGCPFNDPYLDLGPHLGCIWHGHHILNGCIFAIFFGILTSWRKNDYTNWKKILEMGITFLEIFFLELGAVRKNSAAQPCHSVISVPPGLFLQSVRCTGSHRTSRKWIWNQTNTPHIWPQWIMTPSLLKLNHRIVHGMNSPVPKGLIIGTRMSQWVWPFGSYLGIPQPIFSWIDRKSS